MKFENKPVAGYPEILANDHFASDAITFADTTDISEGWKEGDIIKAGAIVPKNDSTAKGVLLYDVDVSKNPNGAVVTHGTVFASKCETPSAEADLKQIIFK